MVRDRSGFSVTIAASFRRFLSPKPVTEHSTSYSGTSANPKPNAPSAMAPSWSASLRCPRARWFTSAAVCLHGEDDEPDVDRDGEQSQPEGRLPHALALVRHHVRSAQCVAPRAMSSGAGASAQLW